MKEIKITCKVCGQSTNPMYGCDEAEFDEWWCANHWPDTPCAKGEHGEGCATMVMLGTTKDKP